MNFFYGARKRYEGKFPRPIREISDEAEEKRLAKKGGVLGA